MTRLQFVERISAAIIALIGWGALALQLDLAIGYAARRGLPSLLGLVIYFGFFTVLTNILAALVLTSAALRPASRSFLAQTRTKSAVAVYITMVGLVYTLLLRHLWSPGGQQFIADTLLHDVMPPLYVIYWVAFVPKGALRWIDAVCWLVYPIGYFAYLLMRGALIGSYPYPFLDAGALGFPRLALNGSALLIAFLAVGFVCVALDRALASAPRQAAAPSWRRRGPIR